MIAADLLLLVLRIISGVLLLTLLAALLIIAWRDYQATVARASTRRRTYGRLIVLQRVDDLYTETGQTHPLLPLTTLGRAPTNNIVIDQSFASSEHARVSLRDGQWWLEDRNSRNGTLLNDELVNTPVIITQDDVIGIGTLAFRVELD